MPARPRSPGVFVDEVPSGVRAIAGVPTSVTAFVGRARRGMAERPAAVTSFSDFARGFGGLWHESTLGFAVVWNDDVHRLEVLIIETVTDQHAAGACFEVGQIAVKEQDVERLLGVRIDIHARDRNHG